MRDTVSMLNNVYQNSQMGVLAITELIPKTNDKNFLNHLTTQLKEYKNINTKAKQLLLERGAQEEELGALAQIGSTLSIHFQTLTDNSTGHMAEMMLQGSTMGIIEATKTMNQHPDADKAAVALADKLLRTEEANTAHLKSFLS